MLWRGMFRYDQLRRFFKGETDAAFLTLGKLALYQLSYARKNFIQFIPRLPDRKQPEAAVLHGCCHRASDVITKRGLPLNLPPHLAIILRPNDGCHRAGLVWREVSFLTCGVPSAGNVSSS